MEQVDDLERKLEEGELDPATGKKWTASKRKKMELTLKNTIARQDKVHAKIAELKKKCTEAEKKLEEIHKAAAAAKTTVKESSSKSSWPIDDQLLLINLRCAEENRFSDKITTSERIWNDIAADFNAGRDDAQKRSATSLIEKHRNIMAKFHLYCTAKNRAVQSGADGDGPTENSMPFYENEVTDLLWKLGMQSQSDIVPPWSVDGEDMAQGGSGNLLVRDDPACDEESDADYDVEAVEEQERRMMSSDSDGITYPATKRMKAAKALRTKTVLQGKFKPTHGRDKRQQKSRAEQQAQSQANAVAMAMGDVLKPFIQQQQDRQKFAAEREQQMAAREQAREEKEAKARAHELQMAQIQLEMARTMAAIAKRQQD